MLVCRKEFLFCPVNAYFLHDCNIATKVDQMVCMFSSESVCVRVCVCVYWRMQW